MDLDRYRNGLSATEHDRRVVEVPLWVRGDDPVVEAVDLVADRQGHRGLPGLDLERAAGGDRLAVLREKQLVVTLRSDGLQALHVQQHGVVSSRIALPDL